MVVKTRLVCLIVLSLISVIQQRYCLGQPLFVTAILDGERVVLSDGSRIELIGVDAIEKFSKSEITHDMLRLGVGEESIRSKGAIAATYVSFLVRSRTVTVSYQATDTATEGDQSFVPAFISVLNDEGQMDFLLNKRIIEDGYAFADPQTPIAYRTQFVGLQKQAMQLHRGLWAIEDGPEKEFPAIKSGASENADPYSRCRSIKGCVWVSGENPEVGVWKSTIGYQCPCDK